MKLGNEGKITIGHRKLQNIVVTTISTTPAKTYALGAVLQLVLLVKAREEGWKLKRAESTFLSFFGIC